MTPSIDVVVPVHNGWQLTESCLSHLREQTLPHTVIVCDNGSTDGTPERLRKAFPEARVLELGTNFGFSAACNRGVRAGSGDIAVLLNNDVFCRPDFLETLVAPLEADDRLGSVGALLLEPGEERIESFGLTVDATLAGYARARGRWPQRLSGLSVLAGPCGAAGAYRREAWEAVGGLDEGVFFYAEDVDLALRLRDAGWATACAPHAVAIHLGSASATERSAWQRYQAGFSRGYFLRRYGVLRRRVAIRALATETVVVLADALVFSRDLAALRGRIAGWRAAGAQPRRSWPPSDAVESRITLLRSLRLRANTYRPSSAPKSPRL